MDGKVVLVFSEESRLFEYLKYVITNHTKNGMEPTELEFAAELWKVVNSAMVIPATQEDTPGVYMKKEGPTIIDIDGDVNAPITEEEAATLLTEGRAIGRLS